MGTLASATHVPDPSENNKSRGSGVLRTTTSNIAMVLLFHDE